MCGHVWRKNPIGSVQKAWQEEDYLAFVDILYDEDYAIWKTYLDDYHPSGLQLYWPNQQMTSRKLVFAGLPMHLIVDAEGNYRSFRSLDVAQAWAEKKVGE